ncbi:endo alpha-1,4 polygalactosaminidase [Actinomadura harenae]|uniref:Endo alpha-1,4 polygalactosaminidase n=2 Tax=Actinomadura harenae TaxID=2483351 RepID=A0A3M2MA50_9ACTN|nr:endo alpha-1,4 polygalactosaminidase [Actinomadura harenae]RMI45753.1 endo alpha-1,4 polygalactosaminidase [Actinomadura harenae]
MSRSMRGLALVLTAVLAAGACGGTGGKRAADTASEKKMDQAAVGAAASWWRPKPRTTWQWQLSGRVDTSVQAQVFDVDLFETPAATVAKLKKAGRRTICYTAIGSAENWRPDYKRFPARVLGKKVADWPGERWVDIRQLNVLRPIWGARLDQCKKKGFDGVEPDWMDGYKNDTGFKLTARDQLAFNRMLATEAHKRGLAIGLKNDLDQIPQLVGTMDFAVNEQCAQYGECNELVPFIKAGKAVFHAEYELALAKFCPTSKKLGLSSIRKPLELTAKRQACPA